MERGPSDVTVAELPRARAPSLIQGPLHLSVLGPSHLPPPAHPTTKRDGGEGWGKEEMERRKTKYLPLSRQGEKNRGKHP